MQNQIDNINERLSQIESNQFEHGQSLSRIEDAIAGSELHPNGVNGRLDKLEESHYSIKKYGTIAAIGLLILVVIRDSWKWILEKLELFV